MDQSTRGVLCLAAAQMATTICPRNVSLVLQSQLCFILFLARKHTHTNSLLQCIIHAWFGCCNNFCFQHVTTQGLKFVRMCGCFEALFLVWRIIFVVGGSLFGLGVCYMVDCKVVRWLYANCFFMLPQPIPGEVSGKIINEISVNKMQGFLIQEQF